MTMRILVGVIMAAALLLAAAPFIVPFGAGDLPERSRALAQEAIARVVAAERATAAKTQSYAQFGPIDAERRAAVGPLDLGPAGDLFSVDTLIDRTGRLHVRAVSKAEAVRAGRVAPVLETAELEPFTRPTPRP